MSCPNYITLSKLEWDRLQKQARHQELTADEEHYLEQQRNLRTLNKLSQKWINTWPNSLQVAAENTIKNRQEKKEKAKRDREYFAQLNKVESNAIQIAKQRIFDSGGYGKQLISALLESKTLEERDAQIQFQKETKQKELEIEKAFGPKGLSLDLRHDHDAEHIARRQKNKEVTQMNINVHKTTQKRIAEGKKKEQLLEVEDAKMAKKLLDSETHAMNRSKEASIQMAKEFAADQKKYREIRTAREKLDEDLAKFWSMHHDMVRCKQREIMDRQGTVTVAPMHAEKKENKKIHKNRYDQQHLKLNYELTEKIYKDANKRYEDFMNKRAEMETMENELSEKELEDSEDMKRKKEKSIELAEFNKMLAGKREVIKRPNVSLKQSLFTKTCKPTLKQKDVKTDSCGCNEEEGVYHPPPFLPHRSNELAQALRVRALQPSPWNGQDAANAYYAKQAGDILAQCKYKQFARKVVDEYRKVNLMDSTTLPVPNY